MKTIAAVEKELCDAIDTKVAAGARVQRHSGGNGRTCGCALSLWAGVGPNGYRFKAQAMFGWDAGQSLAFMQGFDGDEQGESRFNPEHAALGRRLAAKYVDKVQS